MCEFCRYWNRYHPNSATGRCDLHDNDMMEDNTCGDFDQPPASAKDSADA